MNPTVHTLYQNALKVAMDAADIDTRLAVRKDLINYAKGTFESASRDIQTLVQRIASNELDFTKLEDRRYVATELSKIVAHFSYAANALAVELTTDENPPQSEVKERLNGL